MKTDILIIGGGPSGITTALTARRCYPGKEVTLVRREKFVIIPCAIPYIPGALGSVDKDRISDNVLRKEGVNLIIDEVKDVDLRSKEASLLSGDKVSFDKLVLAVGSKPAVPHIEGVNLGNVLPVFKDPEHLSRMKEVLDKAEKVVIVGGGFIGVEFADDLSKIGKEVTIVEMLPHILSLSFDTEFSLMAEKELNRLGVEVRTGVRVRRFLGDEVVEKVELLKGELIDADAVIIATGARPNTDLAEKIGLQVSKYGIEVDEYMRTSHPDVFAVGDCASKTDFFTRKRKFAMLASIATAEARIAGWNLYGIKALRKLRGTLGIFATKVGDLYLGVAGLTESIARAEGFEYIVGESEVPDKHPAAMPRTHKIRTKLLFTRVGGFFLGGQIAGGPTVGEIVNLIGFAIESGYSAAEYVNLQIGTHPYLTPPPTAPATLTAAHNALIKTYGKGKF